MKPDFIIAGAMKCGTTVLYDFICESEKVVSAKQKEIHYFSLYYDKGASWYEDYFTEKVPGLMTGEASPTYFDEAKTTLIPNLIKKDIPDVKLIVMVRNPVDRAISHYNHYCKINKFKEVLAVTPDEFFSQDFAKSISMSSSMDYYLAKVLEYSFYYRKYLHYKSVFGENMLVVRNESLQNDPMNTMKSVYEFLGLDFEEHESFRKIKYSAGTSGDQLSIATREKLNDYFMPDYKKLLYVAEKDGGLI